MVAHIIASGLLMIGVALALPAAADAALERRRDNAYESREACRADPDGHGMTRRGCARQFERDSRRCERAADARWDHAGSGDSYGNFVPLPIPQRQLYILPGMR